MPVKKFFLIDAMAMAFRSHHAMGTRPLMTSKGLPTSAIYGSAQILMKLMEDEKPDYLVVACDSREDTFRHDMFEDYKAHRTEFPEDLSLQMPYLFRLFNAFGLKTFRLPGFEADDIIASFVARFSSSGIHSYIVSGDKDFMQLVSDKIFLYSPQKGGLVKIVDEQGVFEHFHCKPHEVIDVLALIGDSSDNVPGVRGIGETGAPKLITQFHNLENLYQHLDEVANPRQQAALREYRKEAFLSKKLVTLKSDLDFKVSIEELAWDWHTVVFDELLQLFEELEFSTLVKRLQKKRKSLMRAKKAKAPPLSTEEIIRLYVKDSQPRHYKLVKNQETLKTLLGALETAATFAFDTETTGLNIVCDKPIGISFAVAPGEAFYVSLLERDLENIDAAFILKSLAPIFADSHKLKVAHNLKFDIQMLANLSVTVADPVGDTMLAAFLLDATDSFGIDALSRKVLQVGKIPTSALMGKDRAVSMTEVDLPLLSHYACEDADCCLRLHEVFMPRLKENELLPLYETVEIPLARILADMERNGVYINTATLQTISGELAKRGEELESEAHKLAGETFNLNSPKQLQVVLFEKLKVHETLGVKRIKKIKSGFSTDVSVLEALAAHPFVQLLLEYRTIMKIKNTYTDTLPLMIDKKTSRIHTSFNQTGTATGRLSSTNPNLQNIPIRTALGRKIRAAFEGQGDNLLVSADYSQVELRILAHISGDKNLSEAFARGQDVHVTTAAAVFGKRPENVTGDERSQAKAINYGIAYGMGPQRFAATTGVSVWIAREFIAKYFASFPKIRDYMDEAIAFATTHGYTKTLMGRRRPLEGLDKESGVALANARNVAINSPIQGTAADLIKIAMIAIHREIKKRSLSAKMLLQIHDELVFECPEDELETLCRLVKEGMENAMQLSVPLEAAIGHGRNWLEAHQ